MSTPRKHHFLPEWYLSRWKKQFNGEDVIWEFARVGPRQQLRSRYRHPAATGYAKDLYTIPTQGHEDPSAIETKLLQVIDDRGAKAVMMAEVNQKAGPEDKIGLVQFMLSMIHRSPERIGFLEKKLTQRLAHNPLFADVTDSSFRGGALDVFVDLVQSSLMINRMMELSVFVITIGEGGHDLLTGDSPIMMSNGLAHEDAFIMLPTGPRTLIMLAQYKAVPDHLASHDGKVLSKAMNDAIAVQAKRLVFGPDKKQQRFIDNRLNRAQLQKSDAVDPITGLVKWKI